MFENKFPILAIFLLIFLTVGIASASENITDEMALDGQSSYQNIDDAPSDEIRNNESLPAADVKSKTATKIETSNVNAYYKENSKLVAYLRDNDGQPVSHKRVSISINEKTYEKLTDDEGKILLKLNLKPGTYSAKIKFDGDDNCTASHANAIVKVKKASLKITTKDYRTYFESGFYFKAKVINKITKNPVQGIKVVFKVYTSNNKHKIYYGTTDAKGVAQLKKNLKVGSYKVITSVKDKNVKFKKSKAVLTIKQTSEMGCSSLYVQVSGTEAVAGYRRDTTHARTMHIVKCKLNGVPVIKQYKKNTYFFHIIVAANGWMAGTGGIDNPSINHAIEKLVGKMFKEGEIKKSYLNKIRGYERQLGIGHFSIKAPNGKYALVWGSGIKTGKLKAGQYIDVPNAKSKFRHGSWSKFGKNPAKAAIKIAATDKFGINRRDATAFHWKAATHEGKTTAILKAYAANDNGKLAGRSTGHLKDDIYFKAKFFSKNKLPKTPSKMLLGVHKFGSIDKLIKTLTTVKAPKLTKDINESKTFDITVKNKKTKKPVKNLKLKIKVGNKIYTVKTNSKGIARFNPESLANGTHSVLIYSGNIKYYVSAKSAIIIN